MDRFQVISFLASKAYLSRDIVVCSVSGWTMVFKTVSGGARTRIGEWWRQKHPASEFTTAALNTNNHFRGVYKNRIVNNVNWGKFATEVQKLLFIH